VSVAGVALVVLALLATLPAIAPLWEGTTAPETVWLPVAAGLIVMWAVTPPDRRNAIDVRTRDAMKGHPIVRELVWLVVFLLCFIGGTVALSLLFRAVSTDIPFVMAVPAVRVLFLFVMAVFFVDRAGFTLDGHGTAMPALAMGVGERWRWIGLVPIGVALVLGARTMHPLDVPDPRLLLLVAVVAFTAIAIPEEIFFRGMLQTRLELLLGRWGGIAVGAAVFAFTYAVMKDYVEVAPRGIRHVDHPLITSFATYGVLGVLYGYTWSCYRNIWLNVLLRGGTLTLAVAPTLRLIG
jgi:membrane protease YdiL (CAAX protease family)